MCLFFLLFFKSQQHSDGCTSITNLYLLRMNQVVSKSKYYYRLRNNIDNQCWQ